MVDTGATRRGYFHPREKWSPGKQAMIMIRGRRLFIHRHERQIKGFSSPFLNTNTNPDPSTILVGRAYYGIGIESPGGPPVFNSISSFCLVCSLDFTFPLDGSSLVSWRPARIDHRTSRVAEPRLDRVHLRFAFISNSSCSINRSR